MSLKNSYWVLRHGCSIPNELGLIVSHKSNGTLPEYGLAAEGFVQAKAAGEQFLKELEVFDSIKNVFICSSPFARTMETAKCVAEALKDVYQDLEIHVLDELQERYFGPSLELDSHLRYPEVWEIDARSPLVGPEGGESVADVAKRVATLIPQMESEREGHAVLFVSHGDTLQILQTVTTADQKIRNLNTDSDEYISILSQHRKFALLTGELRKLAHGRSIPNELDLVVSQERNGILLKFGLAAEGFKQAEAAAQAFLKELRASGLDKVCIYTSPFSRTIQTAECVLKALESEYPNAQINVLHELKERNFGPVHELKSRYDYSHDDTLDPFVGPEGGESVMEVSERVLNVIRKVEDELEGFAVLIVGHGDVLQILQAMFEHKNLKTSQSEYPSFLSRHKRFELGNCELRRFE